MSSDSNKSLPFTCVQPDVPQLNQAWKAREKRIPKWLQKDREIERDLERTKQRSIKAHQDESEPPRDPNAFILPTAAATVKPDPSHFSSSTDSPLQPESPSILDPEPLPAPPVIFPATASVDSKGTNALDFDMERYRLDKTWEMEMRKMEMAHEITKLTLEHKMEQARLDHKVEHARIVADSMKEKQTEYKGKDEFAKFQEKLLVQHNEMKSRNLELYKMVENISMRQESDTSCVVNWDRCKDCDWCHDR